jgi:hypothetical protein
MQHKSAKAFEVSESISSRRMQLSRRHMLAKVAEASKGSFNDSESAAQVSGKKRKQCPQQPNEYKRRLDVSLFDELDGVCLTV